MGIQLLLEIPPTDEGLTHAVIKLLLLFAVVALGLVVLLIQSQRKYRAYLRERQEEKRRFEKERSEAAQEAMAETRQQIAIDLHDDGTYYLHLALAELDMALHQATLDETRLALFRTAVLLERHKVSLREVSHALKSNPLQQDLSYAIHEEVDRLKAMGQFLIHAHFRLESPIQLDDDQQLLVFRVFQESMNNILKHASANEVTVELDSHARQLTLVIADDGVGFDQNLSPQEEGGISHLYKHANLLKGSLQLTSRRGKGTRIELLVPLSNRPDP